MDNCIAHFRRKAGLTQGALAELAGFTQNAVSRWERGVREPKASSICRLCDALGCTADELLGRQRPSHAEENHE